MILFAFAHLKAEYYEPGDEGWIHDQINLSEVKRKWRPRGRQTYTHIKRH